MGNRWASYETEWLNPPQAPYLHFVNGRYVPSVGNELHIYLGKITKIGFWEREEEQQLDQIVITPLLPNNPIPVHIPSRAEEIVEEIFDNYGLLGRLQQHSAADTIHFVQGAKWGYVLVDKVCSRLQREGYAINPQHVACLGRGKRIPEYRLSFERMQETFPIHSK